MNRRGILGLGVAAAGLAACDCGAPPSIGAAGPSILSGRRELKMVTTWPKDFPGLGAMAERTAQFITEMTGGRITVRVFAAGELVAAFDAFDAVASGAADFYHGAEYYWVGKSKAYPFFAAVPFGMTAVEIMAWTEFGGGQALWDELSAPFGVKPIACGNSLHQLGGWYKKEIRSLDDVKGLKVRMPGMGGEVMRRIGASSVAIPGGEVFQALQSGLIDGAEWVGPWNDLAFGLHREAKFYYWPGFHEPGSQLALGVNLGLWNEFTPEERAIVTAACHRVNHLSLAEFGHFNSIALDTLVRDHDVLLRQWPDDVMRAAAAATRQVLEEAAASDVLSTRIFESFKASLARSQSWAAISEEAYMAARRAVFSL